MVQRRTGLVADAYFSGPKIKWILDNVPGARARAERGELLFGTVESWLIWRLTGGRVHVTDYSNASRTVPSSPQATVVTSPFREKTGFFPVFIRRTRMGIPRSMLPEAMPSSCVYGETDPAFFGAPIPIAGAAGDQQAALFGQTCFDPGPAGDGLQGGADDVVLVDSPGQAHDGAPGVLVPVGGAQARSFRTGNAGLRRGD